MHGIPIHVAIYLVKREIKEIEEEYLKANSYVGEGLDS